MVEKVSNWDSLFHKGTWWHSTSFDLAFTMLEPETPETILSLVQCVDSAAKRACDVIDEQDPHHEVLQDLRQGIQRLKSDTMMYKVFIDTMKNDTNPNGPPTFAIFISTYVRSARVPHLHLQYTACYLQTRWKRSSAKLQSSARGCAALT